MNSPPYEQLYYILDTNNLPVKVGPIEWAQYREKNLRVAEDFVGPVRVSTVFTGVEYPVLWETMIFGGPHDEYQERYSSLADAIAGHLRALGIARGEAS